MELWELIARESIRDLVARYNANGDSGRFEQMLSVFANDASMELVVDGDVRRYDGIDQVATIFTEAKDSFAKAADGSADRSRAENSGAQHHVRHFTATHQIDLVDESHARGRCYFLVLMPHGIDHWGRYIDEYGVRDERWVITRRRAQVDGRPESRAPCMTRRSPDRLLAGVLPTWTCGSRMTMNRGAPPPEQRSKYRTRTTIHTTPPSKKRTEMTDLPDVLELDSLAPSRFQVHMPAESAEGRDVVFSGQLVAQMLMAADKLHGPAKQARSIHATFARAATYTKPVELDVDTILDGRSWASDTLTAYQEGKVMSRAEILSNVVERDLLRHELASPKIPGPDEAVPTASLGFPGTEWREIKDDNLEIDGAPALISWFRYPQTLSSVAANQAILAWGTCGALIGLAMRGNDAIDIAQAHVSISTGVMAHTIHFVEDVDVSEWLSISQHTIHAGRGRVHGRGLVRTEDGQLLATFHQDAMARHFEGSLDPKRSM